MSVRVNLNDVSSGYNLARINSNFERLSEALSDAVSRSGEAPNNLTADLDLDSNDILNGGVGNFESLIVNGTDISDLTGGGGDLLAANNLSDVANAATARTNLGLAIGTNVQAYDADLTTWASLTPSANAQSLVTAANYAAMRTLLGLTVGTDVQAYDADLTTWAGLTPSANAQSLVTAADYSAMRTLLGLVPGTNVQAYDADLTTWAGLTPSANAQSLVTAADYSAMRTLLSLVPGTNVQAYDAQLADIAGITFAQGDILYFNGTNLVALSPGVSGQFLKTLGAGANPTWATIAGGGDLLAANNLSDLASAATARTNLGLAIGTNVQAYDADLTTWAGLTPSANAQSLVTAADYAAMRTLLDLEAGTDFYSVSAANAAFQPLDADLTSWAGVTRASGFDTFAATPSSANLKSLVTDETGSGGALVFATSPAIATPTLTDPIITGAVLEDIYTITDGAAFEVDPSNGSVQLITLTASRTPKATNFAAGESVTLMVADGTAYTLTWSDTTWSASGVVWVGGSAPTLATTGYTVIEFWKVSTTIYGAYVGAVA